MILLVLVAVAKAIAANSNTAVMQFTDFDAKGYELTQVRVHRLRIRVDLGTKYYAVSTLAASYGYGCGYMGC